MCKILCCVNEATNSNGIEVLDMISTSHHSNNLLCYELLLSHGLDCWYQERKINKHTETSGASRNKITSTTFYSWKFSPRENELTCSLGSCGLTKQYLIDEVQGP